MTRVPHRPGLYAVWCAYLINTKWVWLKTGLLSLCVSAQDLIKLVVDCGG